MCCLVLARLMFLMRTTSVAIHLEPHQLAALASLMRVAEANSLARAMTYAARAGLAHGHGRGSDRPRLPANDRLWH